MAILNDKLFLQGLQKGPAKEQKIKRKNSSEIIKVKFNSK